MIWWKRQRQLRTCCYCFNLGNFFSAAAVASWLGWSWREFIMKNDTKPEEKEMEPGRYGQGTTQSEPRNQNQTSLIRKLTFCKEQKQQLRRRELTNTITELRTYIAPSKFKLQSFPFPTSFWSSSSSLIFHFIPIESEPETTTLCYYYYGEGKGNNKSFFDFGFLYFGIWA